MRALLVHGLSSDSSSWWRVRADLERAGWSVTAVDLRGHGAAPRPGSYSLAEYASDLPREGWDVAIGHSLGGAAVTIAAQDPSFAKRLVLLDPVLDVPEDQFDEILADQLSELDLTSESIAQLKPHWDERDRDAKLHGIRATDAFVVERTFTDTGRWDARAEAAALTMPTLILGGDPAVYSMLAIGTADELTAANPNIEYVVVDGSGHSPHRDRPGETLALVREFLLRD